MLVRALLLSAAFAAATPAFAQEAAAPAAPAAAPVTVTEPADFAAMASVSNLFEIETSTLAIERGQSEEVKAFAQQMVTDHTKAAQDMAPAAEAEGLTSATELDQRHQAIVDDMTNLEGADFDAAYIAAQMQAHDEAVALFQGYVDGGADGPLKDFAAATLPTLQMHQEHVRGLSAQ